MKIEEEECWKRINEAEKSAWPAGLIQGILIGIIIAGVIAIIRGGV
ncbi:hypothetical protein KAU51_01975 [Candidatus Parcubacteria bacterium]|nr:hypothetical protein [Candidatus Parcubacteria bacterium]